jgi:hypothetical protein
MPFTYKFTYYFASQGYGWTESYEKSQPAASSLWDLWTGYGITLGNLRLNMLGNTSVMTYCRVSQVGTRFAAQVFKIFKTGLYGAASAFPNMALLMRCWQTAPGPGKSIFLRGIPYTIITAGEYTPTAQWSQAGNMWINYLTNSQNGYWGWIGAQTSVSSLLTGYAQNVNPPLQWQVVVSTKDPIFQGLAQNTKVLVRFSGINGKSELNGSQVCYVQGPSSVLTKDQFGVTPYVWGGRCELPTFGFNTFNVIQAERLMTRKAGAIAFLERGRARVRAKT